MRRLSRSGFSHSCPLYLGQFPKNGAPALPHAGLEPEGGLLVLVLVAGWEEA